MYSYDGAELIKSLFSGTVEFSHHQKSTNDKIQKTIISNFESLEVFKITTNLTQVDFLDILFDLGINTYHWYKRLIYNTTSILTSSNIIYKFFKC